MRVRERGFVRVHPVEAEVVVVQVETDGKLSDLAVLQMVHGLSCASVSI